MSDKKSFYLTTPIFYPNASLHMGHAYVMTIADIMARWQRLSGRETYFLGGSDENTAKVIKVAEESGQSVENLLADISRGFESLYKELEISHDQFIRTSDKNIHWPGALKMWEALVKADAIYKGTYEGLYCVSCETFYTEKELVDGKCPIHGTVPERIKENNYFFRLSKYAPRIKQAIESGEMRVMPESRKNEILAFIDRGLEDVSFSRPKSAVPHGIPVPGDSEQVIYVWCDALVSYISALGYGRSDDANFKKFWPADYHVVGKDILRFHAAIWPGMLLAAGLPLPKNILVHGLIISGGQKMSKTIGNVINPKELIDDYGAEALRYFLARKISMSEDSAMTKESFKDSYNGDLANGLGNLTSRIMKLAETYLSEPVKVEVVFHNTLKDALDNFEIQKAMNHIWAEIGELDKEIQDKKPWETKDKEIISNMVTQLAHIGASLKAFMPKTSEKILEAIKNNKLESGLFPRKDQ